MRARALKPTHPAFALAQAKWRSSGLTDEIAAKLHFQPLSPEETQELHPSFHKTAALKLPYFDLSGKPTDFYRIRYLDKLPGFAGAVEKPQRYAQEPKTLNGVYLPPILGNTWKEIADDNETEIVFTEGELKSAAGASVGLAVVGLGGVDVWRSSKRGISFLPPLDDFKWRGRAVAIVFDSDAAQKPDVVRAQRQLASALVALGARVRIIALPPAPGGGKQGLDDYLVAGAGADAGEATAGDRIDHLSRDLRAAELRDLIAHAPGHEESGALWGMNEELVYVNDPGLVVERATGRAMDPGKFQAHHYSNRYFMELITTEKGTKLKKKPLAPHWLSWESRFECPRMVYEPGKARFLEDGTWNAWPGWGCVPKKGDVSPWKWLLDFLFRGEPEARQWFERWCAYPLQHPGTKLYSSVLIWSLKHGMGKGLAEYMLKSIYGKNAIEIDSDTLKASFNDWAVRKQFVIGNEITAGDARLDKDKLKGMITRDEITINEKYLPRYRLRDCINYIFDSNSPDALFIEDNDRRYFVHEVSGEPASQDFYDKCDAFLHGEGPSYLFHHLLTLDLGDFKPQAPALATKSKRNMIIEGKSDLAYWVSLLRDDPKAMLRPLGEKAAERCDLFQPQQLLRCYDPENMKRVTTPGLARALLNAGFKRVNAGDPVWSQNGAVRLYAIRNPQKWLPASPKDLCKHYEEFFGPNSGKF